jgi:hypothetical protein
VTCEKLGVAAGRKLPIVLAVLFTLFNGVPASAELWHLLHQEVGDALAELSERYFAGPVDSREASASLFGSSERPWAIVVGFTGGFETKQSQASGIVSIHRELDRHSSISVFADGGAESDQHLGALETIARLRPTLIVALDLFYHDFKFSLFLSDSKKKCLRDFIDRLHATGAPVLLGNIASLVLLRHEHVNRYLEALAPEFPNLFLVDVRSLNDALDDGIPVRVAGRELLLKRQDVFADREQANPLESAFLANVLLEGSRPGCGGSAARHPSTSPRSFLPTAHTAERFRSARLLLRNIPRYFGTFSTSLNLRRLGR